MKKLFVSVLAIGSILGISLIVNAAPVGNIASPADKKAEYGLRVAAEADFVSERELDVANESVELEAKFYSAKISYNIVKRFDIYALLGTVSDAEITEKSGSDTYKYFFDDDFAWGLGITALIYEFDNGLRIGADGKYRSAEVDLTEIDVNGTRYGIADISNIAGDFEEWQVALGITREFGESVRFSPYAGVKYSDVEVQAKGTISGTTYETDNVNSKDTVGVFAGTEITFTDNLSVYAEGRFIDEQAVAVGLSYGF